MQDFKLVSDSCCDLTPELASFFNGEMVPFSMLLENINYTDDDSLVIGHWLAAMNASKSVPKSACPPPEAFAQKMRKSSIVFGSMITSKLSGAYNSACMARDIVKKESPGKQIHIFDSKSASAGQLAVACKLRDCIQAGMDFDTTVRKVTHFIEHMHTFFILENLDTLIKNGRMGRIVGYVASAMSLRPIMTAVDGEIRLFEKARGSVRAFTRLVDIIGECCTDFSDRTLVITHCNNDRQAHFIRAEAQKRFSFKEIIISRTGGLSTMYANDGGVIIAF